MEQKVKKTINHYMLSLHRDIGFFIIGLTAIYSISGIVLIYRDTGFLKHEAVIEKTLPPNLKKSELGKELHIKDLKVLKNEGDSVYFQNGTYNKTTGVARYTEKTLPFILNKFNNLHKSSSKSLTHWFSTVFGILLFFMAISSFWMFKPATKLFRRGIYIAVAGAVAVIILLILFP